MLETSSEWTASGVYDNDRFGTAGAAAEMDGISPAASGPDARCLVQPVQISALLLIGVIIIPVLVGTLNKDPQRRRDAHRVLVELVHLLRGRK